MAQEASLNSKVKGLKKKTSLLEETVLSFRQAVFENHLRAAYQIHGPAVIRAETMLPMA